MKSWMKLTAASLALVTVLAGCGGKDASVESKSGQPAGQAASNKLVVYSPQGGDERGEWMKKNVEEATGIEVEFLGGGGGELLDRLIAEKKNPQADVVLGLVPVSNYQLKKSDVYQPYVPSWAAQLPASMKDKDGNFHSIWQTPIVIVYNQDTLKDNGPKDWKDLIKPEFSKKYMIGGLESQTTRAYIAAMLWNYYDKTKGDISPEGWSFMKKLFANAYQMPEGAVSWEYMAKGEVPITPMWLGGAQTNAKKFNINMSYVDATGGSPIVAEGVGIVKGTKNLETARKFVDYIGSDAFLAGFSKQFGQLPAVPSAIEKSPDEVKKSVFKASELDWEVVADKMDSWIEKIQFEIKQ